MNSTYQVVSCILDRMGYKRLSKHVLTCDYREIDLYINLIKLKSVKNKELIEFINYFL